MASTRIKLNLAGLREVKKSPGMKDQLRQSGERVASAWRASAPVASGAYRDSIKVVIEDHPTTAVAHIGAYVDYAMLIEANLGLGSRALDSA